MQNMHRTFAYLYALWIWLFYFDRVCWASDDTT